MVLRFIIVFTILFSAVPCFSQSRVVDSLESLVKTVPADTTKVWLLNRLVTSLRESDNNKALSYALQAKALAETLADSKGQGLALENLGWIYYRRGDYAKAFQLSTEALKIVEGIHDQSAIARCLNNIAAILFEQKQYALAIEHFKKAYVISQQINDYGPMSRSLNNIAYSFSRIKKYDSAAFYASRALQIAEQSNNHYMRGFALRTLGDVDLHHKNFRAALKKFQQIIVIARKSKNIFLEVSTLHRLGKTYAGLHELDKAINYVHQNIALASQAGYKEELERSYKVLSELYVLKKDIGKAFEYQSQYVAIHDSLYSQRNSEQLALLQARFDSEMKQAEIELLTKDTQLKQEEINHQRVWMYFFIGCLSLVLILAFVLFYNNRVRRNVNLALEAKNKEINLQAQQLGNLNITKDKLFSIISHDLRSPLASLRGLIDLVNAGNLSHGEFSEVSKKLKRNLDSVNEDLDNLLLWAQSQLKGLQVNAEPVCIKSVLDDKINLYKEISKAKNITIINEVEEDLFVRADRNHIGLVIRNLLGNAIKFNQSGGVVIVRQKILEHEVEISVSDSGVGMHVSDVKKLFNAETHFTNPGTNQEKGAGIGLLLAKEFVEKNGGAIWVTSELGKGSTFTFTLKRDFSHIQSKAV